ncbi:Aste57867_20342 [Aphanomyces stellatus]|uniref:Aste57867_20342 protein n=1 Tax=Aphanomyces stellatus TaxID=120398 RepID=A0A485LFZ0_9STRA|nr:hypothetical protein As57867_020276 [Aphanomyces stellatus]VFT97029.1 Aste57867_20342 [Aphanomyces stellatus]
MQTASYDVADAGIARFQAVFRGQRSRKLHVERVKLNLGRRICIYPSVLSSLVAWAPFVPAAHDAVHAMLALAAVTPNDVVLDIGCGDGRIVFAAVEAPFHARRAVGVDIDVALVAQCRHHPRYDPTRVEFLLDDWIQVDMMDATVLTLFFLPHESIARLLRQKCRPGTRVVTYVFAIPEWTPVATAATVPFLNAPDHSPLFLYIV